MEPDRRVRAAVRLGQGLVAEGTWLQDDGLRCRLGGVTVRRFDTEQMTDEEMVQKVEALFPGKSANIVVAFKQRTPNAKPFDIWSHIAASTVRENAIKQCKAKAALGKAPAYLYWFTWQTPILDGRPRAFHCAEIAFAFDNVERCENMTGGGADARAPRRAGPFPPPDPPG